MRPTDERGRPIGASLGGLPAGEATRSARGLRAGFPQSWKVMENPGKKTVMESHGKVMENEGNKLSHGN